MQNRATTRGGCHYQFQSNRFAPQRSLMTGLTGGPIPYATKAPRSRRAAVQRLETANLTTGDTMASAVQDLIGILDLEPLEVNLFRGRSPQSSWQRVFGGQVLGQALVAACRTVDDVTVRPPHSLHAYFLIGGDPKVPIIYEVDRIRDGRSFTTRRVVAIQHGHAIFSMSVSFHGAEGGRRINSPCPTCRSRMNCRAK